MAARHPDPYKILGLEPGSGLDQVKQAYRRLAKAHHPDMTGESTEAFQRICSAYEQVMKQDFRMAGQKTARSDTGFFCKSALGRDIFLDLWLNLEDVARGRETVVQYRRAEPCPDCRSRPQDDCPVCLGRGRVFNIRGRAVSPESCPGCGGPENKARPCLTCRGSTLIQNPARVPIKTPPGIEAGALLRLPGQGDYPPAPGFLPGDLYIKIVIRPHPLFKPQKNDLHLWWNPRTWPSSQPALVPTLSGQVRLQHLPRPGQIVRLPGKGLPGSGASGHGDLYIHY
ncbi:MAG: DnaJ C-terminal domain-containing protein [Thermodesulfobacteriota bacterium]|nr:DnaJ C-terminal domain-containing protein [Thermodesulfobacteriota bacterium]